MVWKYLQDGKGSDQPTHAAVIFDHSARTFRNDIYPLYKANRPEPPEDLRPQFPLTREATRAFNIACIETEGFEADDIIASLACQARDAGGRVTIISSDKDLMQLVGGGVEMMDPIKGKPIGPDEVREKFVHDFLTAVPRQSAPTVTIPENTTTPGRHIRPVSARTSRAGRRSARRPR